MLIAFLLNGVSVNARRYAHHEKESGSNRAVRRDRHGISCPGYLSHVLRVADVPRRSAVSHNSSRQIALHTGKGAA